MTDWVICAKVSLNAGSEGSPFIAQVHAILLALCSYDHLYFGCIERTPEILALLMRVLAVVDTGSFQVAIYPGLVTAIPSRVVGCNSCGKLHHFDGHVIGKWRAKKGLRQSWDLVLVGIVVLGFSDGVYLALILEGVNLVEIIRCPCHDVSRLWRSIWSDCSDNSFEAIAVQVRCPLARDMTAKFQSWLQSFIGGIPDTILSSFTLWTTSQINIT